MTKPPRTGPWACTRTIKETGQPCGAVFGDIVGGVLYIGSYEVQHIILHCHLCGCRREWHGRQPKRKQLDIAMAAQV